RKVPTPPILTEPLARVTARLTGGAAELIPLPIAFTWVEAHEELWRRTWPGTRLFEAFLDAIGVKASAG
ncbi:MAG TPA: hypothetical protein VHB21_06435, partial [Minicystis sp.]|nr:hypothetical protein [Minicystis sp.]